MSIPVTRSDLLAKLAAHRTDLREVQADKGDRYGGAMAAAILKARIIKVKAQLANMPREGRHEAARA